MVDNLNCDFCQRTKLDGKGYIFLPEHEVQSILFEECVVDLIGPWNIQVCGKPHKFEAFDVPIQDPKPRFQTKITSHNCCLFFVCLFASFTNSRMENDSQMGHIRDVCTTAKNPQDMASTKEYINEALSIAMHAMIAAINSTLASSPGSLTFNRDMFLNIPLIADWHKDEHI
jgi:hypothetical protein